MAVPASAPQLTTPAPQQLALETGEQLGCSTFLLAGQPHAPCAVQHVMAGTWIQTGQHLPSTCCLLPYFISGHITLAHLHLTPACLLVAACCRIDGGATDVNSICGQAAATVCGE
jgi:hypothetical protein